MSEQGASPLPTKERLARAMEAALCPVQMIASARAGMYDDFESDLALPIMHLVKDLRAIGQTDLVVRAMAGEFDSTKEESEAWAQSPEGRSALRDLRT